MAQLPVALIVGLLAGAWAFVSPSIGVLTWPAFIAWAFFYVAGAETRALPKVAVPLASGVLLGWLAVLIAPAMGSLGMPIAVTIIATLIVLMGSHPLFALSAAQFGGAASFFGSGGDLIGTLIALGCGLVLGVLSVTLPALLPSRSRAASAAG
jgi:hypothetical protein